MLIFASIPECGGDVTLFSSAAFHAILLLIIWTHV